MSRLDEHGRGAAVRGILGRKAALRRWYAEIYAGWRAGLARCPATGDAIEIGAGGGFAKKVVPELISTDVQPYDTIDRVVDARALPFPDGGLRAICMLNTLHHISAAERFFREATRCLAPGGRIFITDQYHGWLSRLILAYAHHEPYEPHAPDWCFATSGPVSGANGALAWIIFCRDREQFEQRFPGLRIEAVRLHSPLRYWLAGGLRRWTLLPAALFRGATAIDRYLACAAPQLASFMDIELVRVSD